MSYQNNLLFVMAAVMAPYLRGSPDFLFPKTPQCQLSPLETQVLKSDGHWLGRNNRTFAHDTSVMVPFHRGIPPEPKKSPAPHSQRVHGYRTPRHSYRKAAEHR